MREEHRLRVFENRVLRIFGPNTDEITGEGRNYIMRSLMIGAPHPYCAGNKIENEMGGACSAYGEGRDVYMVLVGKPEGNRPFGRPRRRWEDNNTGLQEVGCGGVD